MLTDTTIRKAKPTDKPQRLFDGNGLYIEISPAGSRLWRLKYRFNGQEKRLALGKYPDTSLADAREQRDAARKLLAAGIDPREQQKIDAAEKTKARTIPIGMDAHERMDVAIRMSTKAHASRPMAALGVSEMEEHVYRALLKHRLATVKEVADTLALPPKRTQRLLDSLSGKGLATATPERTPHYIAASPELAIKALTSRRLADIERAQMIIPELKEYAGNFEDPEHEQIVELIRDRTILGQLLLHAHQAAEHEIICFQRAPSLAPPAPQEDSGKDLRIRSISDSSYIELPGAWELIKTALRAGEQSRICSSLPVKMLVLDRRIGFIPLNSGDPNGPILLVRPCALLDALCALFEFYWERATPISITATGDLAATDVASGLSEGAQSLIPLLAAGLNDKASAFEAGMSEATLARRIAELMKHYDTRTRFQLGWRAALEAYPDGLPKAR